MIDFTPAGRNADGAVQYAQNPGGAPANVAAALAKLGRRTAFIGKVGFDPFGRYVRGILEQSQVGTEGLVFTEDAHTTLAFVHLDEQGDRSFSFCRKPGADQLLEPNEVRLELIEDAKLFHFGSLSMTHEPARSATMKAVTHAQNSGKLISYDPNLRASLWKDLQLARSMIEAGLRAADIVKLSEEELLFMTGESDPGRATRKLCDQYHIPLLFVTLGAKGCFFRLGDHVGWHDGYAVNVVDTTGAGDAFMAAVLFRITTFDAPIGEMSIEEAKRIAAFANAAGALTTSRKGAIPACPDLAEITALLNKH